MNRALNKSNNDHAISQPVNVILGKNKQGVQLEPVEIEMLQFLLRHRYLTAAQIHRLVKQEKKCTLRSYSNRLVSKLSKTGIVNKGYVMMNQAGFKYNYYSLGKLGMNVLIDCGLETSDTRNLKKLSNLDHHFLTKNILIDILMYGKSVGHIYKEYMNKETDMISADLKLYPDWLIEFENRVLCIEADMGTEHKNILKEKVKKYGKLAKQFPEKEFCVLFSVVDSSVPNKRFDLETNKRVEKIKLYCNTLPMIYYSNLHFYAVPLVRAAEIGYMFLEGGRPTPNHTTQDILTTALEEFRYHSERNNTDAEKLQLDTIYSPDVSRLEYADMIVRFSDELQRGKNFLLLFVEEGSIYSYNKVMSTLSNIKKGRFKKPIDKFILVYSDEEQLQNDVHDWKPSDEILFIDARSLINGRYEHFMELQAAGRLINCTDIPYLL